MPANESDARRAPPPEDKPLIDLSDEMEGGMDKCEKKSNTNALSLFDSLLYGNPGINIMCTLGQPYYIFCFPITVPHR